MPTIGLESPEPSEKALGRRRRRTNLVKVLDHTALGLVFPVAMILGYLGGRLVGGWFDAAALGGLVGGLVGVVAGFYNVFKLVKKLDRNDPPGAS